MKKTLIIDGGGTSIKFYEVIGGSLTKSWKSGQGNLMASYKDALNNYFEGINKSSCDTVAIFAAGYFNLSISKKEQFYNEILRKFQDKKIYVNSDSSLPLFYGPDKTVSITIGTGTSIAYGNANNPQVILGYGHIIGDPLSGYSLARNVIFMTLATGTKIQKEKLYEIYNVDNQADLVSKIYSNQQKTFISDKFINFINDDVFSKIIDKSIDIDKKLFLNDAVINILKNSCLILLNGTVANSPKISNIFKEFNNVKKIPQISELIEKVASNF